VTKIDTETRIEGIRKTNVRSWAVVLSYPVGHDEGRAIRLGSEFKGQGAKAKAIRAAGTNRVVA
jgi:hypothetical protein